MNSRSTTGCHLHFIFSSFLRDFNKRMNFLGVVLELSTNAIVSKRIGLDKLFTVLDSVFQFSSTCYYRIHNVIIDFPLIIPCPIAISIMCIWTCYWNMLWSLFNFSLYSGSFIHILFVADHDKSYFRVSLLICVRKVLIMSRMQIILSEVAWLCFSIICYVVMSASVWRG
jgi:hypothetical protein